jgi:hypothetical protein
MKKGIVRMNVLNRSATLKVPPDQRQKPNCQGKNISPPTERVATGRKILFD